MFQTAIVAGIDPNEKPDLSEIIDLTEAAGVRVIDRVAQRRDPVPGTVFGAGKVDEIAALIEQTNVDAVVIDRTLRPQETVTLEDTWGVGVIDRQRLVLEIFAERARTRRAKFQVELARLTYALPRIEERDDPARLNIALETGTRLNDVEERITRLERELEELPPVATSHIRRADFA